MRLNSVAIYAVCLLLVPLLSGCASPTPEPTLYLLRGTPSEGVGLVDPDIRVGLGRIVVAPYLLAGAGIVVETEPGQVRPARLHRWAEPLDSGVRWYLRSSIAEALGHDVGGGLSEVIDWDYNVDVYIGRLHGSMTGDALLEAAWVVRSTQDDVPLAEFRFSKRRPLSEPGYAGLVAAEQALLQEFSRSIADSLRPRLESAAIP